ALKDLRELGYIHLDIKPDNILLDPKGHLRICDLGQARPDYKNGYTHLCGTPGYAAPEICLNATCCRRSYDCQVDIWSVGVIIMEMLSG
ncbi:kinase-like protein, partial [Obba rivulosa]